MENAAPAIHPPVSRAWYSNAISGFLEASPDHVFASLADNRDFDLTAPQREAWQQQIKLLQESLQGLHGGIAFEFTVPRLGRRIDVALLIGSVVFVLEFKVGEQEFSRSAYEQVWDYALDLKNFHAGSHALPIVPILIATGSKHSEPLVLKPASDDVYSPLRIRANDLRTALDECVQRIPAQGSTDLDTWLKAPYRPTPTIVEAARALYAKHSVAALARYDAGAKNLAVTSLRLEELIDKAREEGKKLICFVTGVPGAGKTLVGLNIATQHGNTDDLTHAVYLSGNGPLVNVLREALARDEVERKRREGVRIRKQDARRQVESFIQNIHHFRDEGLQNTDAPDDNVVIFDEAQRAWNLRQTANFMRQRRGITSFSQSEPEFLIDYMNRHKDWAVIICLVGGGQEINTGEAGIAAWLAAIKDRFPQWHVHMSDHLRYGDHGAADLVSALTATPRFHLETDLHLSVSLRSFRAENVSAFVNALLDCERQSASELLKTIRRRFPIVLTRNLETAKEWIRSQARGSERYGLVSSSKALRLKPHAIDVRVNIDPVLWFLNGPDDTRSSYYLEDAATEFQVQGLELDWTCVTWDADLRFTDGGWSYHDFRGNKWTCVNQTDARTYLKNAYRVLLTRARQGMVIFVPPGDERDATRWPELYEPISSYLQEVGIPSID